MILIRKPVSKILINNVDLAYPPIPYPSGELTFSFVVYVPADLCKLEDMLTNEDRNKRVKTKTISN